LESRAKKGDVQLPVTEITPKEIDQFCKIINQELRAKLPSGYVFRLPTEAEWEYASKNNGTDCNGIFSFAIPNPVGKAKEEEAVGPKSKKESYSKQNLVLEERLAYMPPIPVGQKRPNALGLYDMLGNCWEVMLDKYAQPGKKFSENKWAGCNDVDIGLLVISSEYQDEEIDPVRVGKYHFLRGDGWFSADPSMKLLVAEDVKLPTIGFRLVVAVDPKNLKQCP